MDEPQNVERIKQKLDSYKPSQATVQLVRETPILLLVGASGAGKGSIKQELLKSDRYHHIVSHTTRPPRENDGVPEQDGTDYNFINFTEAERMLDDGAFVEAKWYSGNVYGTSAAEIEKARNDQKTALTDIEVQGIAEYEAIKPDLTAVFVLPPNYEVWQERLIKRYDGQIDAADLARRMQTAKAELHEALDKDYFRFVVNDDLDVAVREVNKIAADADAGEAAQEARALAQELLKKL